MDWNIPQHYEVKQVWWQQIPQEKLNKQVQIEQERQKHIIWEVQNFLIKDGSNPERVKELIYWFVWDIVVVTNKEWKFNFFKYSKENWVEFYANPESLEKDEDLPFALKETWYDLKNGKLFIWWKEIPQFLANWNINSEFMIWIDNINFYTEVWSILWLTKTIEWWKQLRKFNADSFYFSILAGVTRIKDVMYFAWKWYIPKKEDVLRLLKRAVQELPNQCSDMRFVRNPKWQEVWMEVTKQELDEYLHPTEWSPLITQKMYDDCLKRIEARDRKINEMNWVKEQSRTERKIEWTRNWFVDRVKGILGF